MTIRSFLVPVTVNASGAATVYSPKMHGLLESIAYIKTDFADGVDFTITDEDSGESLWTESDVNAAVTKRTRAPTHTTAGVAAVFASGGTGVNNRIAISGRVKIVIAQGGVSKSGAFRITIDG